MTTGKTIALTSQQSNVSVLNMLSRLIIAFLPRSKHLLISWLQSPSDFVWGGGRSGQNGELTVHGTGLLFGGNEIFLKLMGVIFAQLCKYIKNY